jgi:hypothetical protein
MKATLYQIYDILFSLSTVLHAKSWQVPDFGAPVAQHPADES